jgi:dephospho-CoA kinase
MMDSYAMMHFMLHVGLTGNIGTGKSHAASVFAELGARIVDADIVAHELMEPGREAHQKVVQAFGEGILEPSGAINRKVLGKIVFENCEKRLLLNSLVHPAVHLEILRRMVELEKEGSSGVIIVDAALLVENAHHKYFDRLIVVTCDPNLQLARIMKRDGISLEEARQRRASQMPIEEKLKLADYVIETSGTLKETRVQIEDIYRELLLQGIKT